jgi:uncharacterized protein (DUF2235 family)
MLNAMGLLRDSDTAFAKPAYDLYEEYNRLPPSSPQKEKRDEAWSTLWTKWKNFRTEHMVKQPFVEFLGCWSVGFIFPFGLYSSSLRDSVNSVGFMDNIKLAYTATNGIVRTFRHAVALDERRAKFKQNMWSQPKKPEAAANAQPNVDNGPVTDVQEVWFAGCHCGTSISHLAHTLYNIVSLFRRRRWLRAKRHAAKPRAHPAALDDPRVLQGAYRHNLPRHRDRETRD